MPAKLNNFQTARTGIEASKHEIRRRGGSDIREHNEGHKRFIIFTGLDGKSYQITTRSKTKGTWQTQIEYGEPCEKNESEREFWLFVDLGFTPPKFYPVPLWWISNDIYKAHQKFLAEHGGHRPRTKGSSHHAVPLNRIRPWEGKWSNLSLK